MMVLLQELNHIAVRLPAIRHVRAQGNLFISECTGTQVYLQKHYRYCVRNFFFTFFFFYFQIYHGKKNTAMHTPYLLV